LEEAASIHRHIRKSPGWGVWNVAEEGDLQEPVHLGGSIPNHD
jgi:hypothetical protein